MTLNVVLLREGLLRGRAPSPIHESVDERVEQVVEVGDPHRERVEAVFDVDVENARVDDVVWSPADDGC